MDHDVLSDAARKSHLKRKQLTEREIAELERLAERAQDLSDGDDE